jgi:dienelactone hydrolase
MAMRNCIFIITVITGIFMIAKPEQVSAALKTERVAYQSKDASMEGYLAYDDDKKFKTPRPAILIVHDWMGLRKLTEEKAESLAKQGYVAFAVDIFGKNIRPQDSKEAGKLIGGYLNNRDVLREHIRAAYNKIITLNTVDINKIIVMGYCFGGTTALELARSGVNLAGTASFHGGLGSPTPEDAKNIHGYVLIMHGKEDKFVSPEDMNNFKEAMQKYHINMKFIEYEGAVHAFTNPEAGSDKSTGLAYNAAADKKSWQDFQDFLKLVAPIE